MGTAVQITLPVSVTGHVSNTESGVGARRAWQVGVGGGPHGGAGPVFHLRRSGADCRRCVWRGCVFPWSALTLLCHDLQFIVETVLYVCMYMHIHICVYIHTHK